MLATTEVSFQEPGAGYVETTNMSRQFFLMFWPDAPIMVIRARKHKNNEIIHDAVVIGEVSDDHMFLDTYWNVQFANNNSALILSGAGIFETVKAELENLFMTKPVEFRRILRKYQKPTGTGHKKGKYPKMSYSKFCRLVRK